MNKDITYLVYCHTSPNGKRYVGMTSKTLEERSRNGNGYYTNTEFHKDILLFGWDNIKHELLIDNLSLDDAMYWEKYYIQKFCTQNPDLGYNTSEGGNYCPVGWHHTEEAKKRMSEGHKLILGKTPGFKGKQHTEEAKTKMSEAKRGENNPMYGKHHSEEAKRKQSEVKRGANHPMYDKRGEQNPLYNTHWYNNGEIEVRTFECPEGFSTGRLPRT